MASEIGSVVATGFGTANIVSSIGIGPGSTATEAAFTYITDENFILFADFLDEGERLKPGGGYPEATGTAPQDQPPSLGYQAREIWSSP